MFKYSTEDEIIQKKCNTDYQSKKFINSEEIYLWNQGHSTLFNVIFFFFSKKEWNNIFKWELADFSVSWFQNLNHWPNVASDVPLFQHIQLC